MKALSIKQPWASLIAHGIKDIENRTWKTNYRGRIYVHASSKMAQHEFTHEQSTKIAENFFDFYMPFSAIIGEVDIVDCVINHGSIWAEVTPSCSPHYPLGLDASVGNGRKDAIYNWVLANPVLYDEPILNVKGSLSLWEWKG